MLTQVLTTQKFGDIDIQVIKMDGDPDNLWFTSEDIGIALELNEPRIAVNKIYQRHQDELKEFSTFTNLRTNTGLRETRIYSEQGLYLITMFARSEKAKGFRRWVVNLVKAYRQGKLSLSKAAIARRELMREERMILREQRMFWLTLEKIVASIRQGDLTIDALDPVPALQYAVKRILECSPMRQLTPSPRGGNQ